MLASNKILLSENTLELTADLCLQIHNTVWLATIAEFHWLQITEWIISYVCIISVVSTLNHCITSAVLLARIYCSLK